MARFILPYIDASNEDSAVDLYVPDGITDLQITGLHDAIVALTVDGNQQSRLVVTTDKDGTDTGKATNKLAQREAKFLCSALSSNGKTITREIPCIDLTQTSGDASTVDLTAGVGLAFKIEWDAHVKDEFGNNTVLQEVRHVGRNT